MLEAFKGTNRGEVNPFNVFCLKFYKCKTLLFFILGLLTDHVVCSKNLEQTFSNASWSDRIDETLKNNYDSALNLLLLAQKEAAEKGDKTWQSYIEKKLVETFLRLDRIEEASNQLIQHMANQEEKIPEKDFLFNELLYAKIEYHSGSVWESYVRTIELFESMEQLDDVEIVSHFYLHLAGIFNLVNLDNQMKVCLDKLKGFKDISEETRLHSSMLLLDLYKRSENNQQVIIMAHDLYERILEMGFTTLLPEMYLLYADISVDTGDLIEAQNYLKKSIEIAQKVGYDRYSPALFRLGNLLSEKNSSEALVLVNSALSSLHYSLRDLEGFSHLNSLMRLYNNAKKMDNPEYDLFFDRFRELSKTKVYLSSDFSKIRADQESKNILNDYQSESHDNAFRVVLIFFVGTILCVLGLIFMRLVVIKGKSRKKKPKFTQILTQAENERLFLDRIKIEESIDKKLNGTDWQILELLSCDHLMTNKLLAEKVKKSEEGISSSLRKMYALFNIEVASNKKVALMNKLSLISSEDSN